MSFDHKGEDEPHDTDDELSAIIVLPADLHHRAF